MEQSRTRHFVPRIIRISDVMALRGWHFRGREKTGLMGGLCLVLAFGANLEQRTALRREPMTDLGVFPCASWAIWRGEPLQHHGLAWMALCVPARAGNPVCSARASATRTFACPGAGGEANRGEHTLGLRSTRPSFLWIAPAECPFLRHRRDLAFLELGFLFVRGARGGLRAGAPEVR
jgi:hypothetical protein